MTLEHPADPVAESFRLLRTNLAFMDVDGTVKSLLVTSSLQGEGKSVTVANLAVTLALAGKKVVVVDADLRRPRQHRLFDLPNETGASNVAVGDADLISTLRSVDLVSRNGDGSRRLHELGGRQRGHHQALGAHQRSDTAQSRRDRRLAALRADLEPLRDEADLVLVDSPAMLAVGDTAALASEVDGVIFLVDMEKARRPVLQAAADQLYRLPCAMMGLVIRLQGGGHGDRYHYYSRYSDGAEIRPKPAPSGDLAARPGPRSPAAPAAPPGVQGPVSGPGVPAGPQSLG